MKCFNILCTGKFDRHNFIRREKKRGERARFSVILKYIVFVVKKKLQLRVSKFETFIMQLKASFTVLSNF